jgi:hypothetical protein
MTDAAADMGARVTFSLSMHYFTCSIAPMPQRYNKDGCMGKLADFKVVCGLFIFAPKHGIFCPASGNPRFPLKADG